MIKNLLDRTVEYVVYINDEIVHRGKGIHYVIIETFDEPSYKTKHTEEAKNETGTVSEGYEQLNLPGIL